MNIYEQDTIELPQIEFTNQNGNARASVRNALTNETIELLRATLNQQLLATNVNGGFSVAQGVDTTTGKTVWTHITIKTNTKDPSIDDYTGKPSRKTTTPIIPNIFE